MLPTSMATPDSYFKSYQNGYSLVCRTVGADSSC